MFPDSRAATKKELHGKHYGCIGDRISTERVDLKLDTIKGPNYSDLKIMIRRSPEVYPGRRIYRQPI
ncbi:MAG TPA: hypothetical protein DEQ34_02700 [Balneolaceae bacterium]|nr:hypothetical protein [Balneolaceae bacterium]